MGYTNYWNQHRPFTPQEWFTIARDTQAIIAEADRRGVKIAGASGTGKPNIGEAQIAFNGFGEDESYETFSLTADPGQRFRAATDTPTRRHKAYASRKLQEWTTTHASFEFCKTERRPYDGVVKAVLARAHFVAPDAMDFSWDGTMDEYVDGADAGPWNPSTPSPSAATYVRALWPDHYDAMLAHVEKCAEGSPDNAPWPQPVETLFPDRDAIDLTLSEPPPARRGPGSNQYQDKPPLPRSAKRSVR